MPLENAGRGLRGEAAAVVRDRAPQALSVETAGHTDVCGLSVPSGVHDQFPDDAQERVHDVVGELFARHGKADGEVRVSDVGL